MSKNVRFGILVISALIAIAIMGVIAVRLVGHDSAKPNYSAAVLGAKEGFSPLLPKDMPLADSSFTNGVLVYSVTNSNGTRFVITQQKTPNGFTSEMFRGSRSIPTLYGIAKSTNLYGNTTVGLITTKGVMVTITATPAAGNEQVDALLSNLRELES